MKRKLSLTTARGIPESLSNICAHDECPEYIMDAAEDSKTGKEFLKGIRELHLLRHFEIERETENYVRLKGTDAFGNISFLKAYK